MLTINTFYKVIVLKVDLFDSSIIEERHFDTQSAARAYKSKFDGDSELVSVIVRM